MARKRTPAPARLSITLTVHFTDTRGLDLVSRSTADILFKGLVAAAETLGHHEAMDTEWKTANVSFKARVP